MRRSQFCLFLTLPGLLLQAESAVVATVNGEQITGAQLDSAVRKQIEAIEERARQIRQAALNKLIDNLLLEQAARAENRSVSEYLFQHVESVAVSPAEVDQAYERSREQFPGVLPAEAKYRIRRTLEDNRRASALNALLDGLRRQARITNDLLEHRLSVLDFEAQTGPALGTADAPVTIVEFADFECPYCRTAQTGLKRVIERWPSQVRLVFKHFPLESHANAFSAAQAGVCAHGQGRFWAFHDSLFSAQKPLDDSSLRTEAAAAGLDLAQFDACFRSEESAEAVRKDVLLGRQAGVEGTPALFVNRRPVAVTEELYSTVEQILGSTQIRAGGAE